MPRSSHYLRQYGTPLLLASISNSFPVKLVTQTFDFDSYKLDSNRNRKFRKYYCLVYSKCAISVQLQFKWIEVKFKLHFVPITV